MKHKGMMTSIRTKFKELNKFKLILGEKKLKIKKCYLKAKLPGNNISYL
jgi:hypothetical protein